MHRRIAERIGADASIVDRAREKLAIWMREGRIHGEYAEAWRCLLDGPREVLVALLTEDSERARDLRQATPFTFVLSPRERWSLWREVRRRMERVA